MISQFKIYDNGEHVDTVNRKMYKDYDDNKYINYKGDTIKAKGEVYYQENEAFLDQPHDPVTQYRKVFDSPEEVAHAWAHQTQKEASFRDHQMYFEGRSIFSYGSHFEIARLLDIPSEENPVVIFDNSTHSNTTTGHQSAVKSAIPDNWKVFHFDGGAGYYGGNGNGVLDYYVTSGNGNGLFDYVTNDVGERDYLRFVNYHLNEMEELRDLIPRKRRKFTYRYAIDDFRNHRAEIKEFIDTFKCKSVLSSSQLSELEKPVFESGAEFIRKTKMILTAEKRMEQRRLEKEQEKLDHFVPRLDAFLESLKESDAMDPIAFWRKHDTYVKVEPDFQPDVDFWRNNRSRFNEETGQEFPQIGRFGQWTFDHAYVRWNEKREQFQTSKSAYISPDNIRSAFIVYDHNVEEGMDRSTGTHDFVGIGERMPYFGFSSIPYVNCNGDFRYGCHTIHKEEVERVRKMYKEYVENRPATVHEHTI